MNLISKEITNSLLKLRIGRFTTYGFLLGITLPVLVILIIELSGINLVPSDCEKLFYIGFAILFVVSCLLLIAFGNYEKNKTLANILILTATILSVICLHIFVVSTGGTLKSIFKSYYLYIPVVLVITFGAKLSYILVLGMILILASSILNTFTPSLVNTHEMQVITEGMSYKVTYLVIYLLQLSVVIKTNFEIRKQ